MGRSEMVGSPPSRSLPARDHRRGLTPDLRAYRLAGLSENFGGRPSFRPERQPLSVPPAPCLCMGSPSIQGRFPFRLRLRAFLTPWRFAADCFPPPLRLAIAAS